MLRKVDGIPDDFTIQQRSLMHNILLFLKKDLSDVQRKQLLKLHRILLRDDTCGKKFSNVVSGWRDSFKTNTTLHRNMYPHRQFQPVPVDTQIAEYVSELENVYGKVILFPQLFKNKLQFDLFNADLTINTSEAIRLLEYASKIAIIASLPFKVTADDRFQALKEILEPLIFKMDLLCPEVYKAIFENCRNWDPTQDILDMPLSEDCLKELSAEKREDDKYYLDPYDHYVGSRQTACCEVQQTILNSLDYLRILKSALLDPENSESHKQLLGTLYKAQQYEPSSPAKTQETSSESESLEVAFHKDATEYEMQSTTTSRKRRPRIPTPYPKSIYDFPVDENRKMSLS